MVFMSNILLMFKVAGVSVWTMYRICIGLFEMHIRVKQVAWYKLPLKFTSVRIYIKCADVVLS